MGISVLSLWCLAAPPALDAAIDAKLERQWQRYQNAVLDLEGRLASGKDMRRDEWEAALADPPGEAWSGEEVQRLAARQAERVGRARERARRASPVDLGRIRERGAVGEFCADFPKGGMLHVHGDFLAQPDELERILDATNPVIDGALLATYLVPSGRLAPRDARRNHRAFLSQFAPPTTYAELTPQARDRLRSLLYVGGQTVDLEYLTARPHALRVLFLSATRLDVDPFRQMWEGFLQRCLAQRVSYLEVTESTTLTASELETLRALAAQATADFGITLKFLVSRSPATRASAPAPGLAAAAREGTILGLNLRGHGERYPIFESARTLLFGAKRSSLRRTVHSGSGGSRDLRDALLLGAERLSHALALQGDPVLLEHTARLRLPLEATLVSDLRLSHDRDISSHPFLYYLRLGLRVSLSTDNDALLSTSPNLECALAVRATDIEYLELRELALNSIDTAFVDDELRAGLRRNLEADLRAFEARWRRR